MNRKALVLIIVVLASMVFISGCTQTTSIRSQEEVGQAVTNVSTDIEDVSSTLDSIDRTLGGTK
ncbi:MAG: hypothetical protein J4400_03215 [Candidatus Aenigmarchaeota archaeon]|nr:hypothetical protein [Candidatus Aenigmarchaeota archaeon]